VTSLRVAWRKYSVVLTQVIINDIHIIRIHY